MNDQKPTKLVSAQNWWPFLRDIIAFLGGLSIMAYETIAVNVDRPWLLVMAIGMMGLPFALRLDRLIGNGKQ
jgi:hypothetical protein